MAVKDRNTAIFYTYGMCNLNCRYCGIDKNPVLKEIDKALEKSFEGDYYFERVKKYFPNRGQLKSIQTWGGEPFMGMHRIYPLLHQIINYYPYFEDMYSSTNFSYPAWTDEVFGLFKQFGDYPYRDFSYCLQLSCDGPEYINDANRGKGVTKRCLDNFNKFCELLGDRIPENLSLTISLKPTLDLPSIHNLCDKQKIIEYYQFFEENFIYPIKQLNFTNVNIALPVPNTAVPSPVTKEDGLVFAEFCRLCREIEYENEANHYFEYYTKIIPFYNDINQNCLTYRYSHHTCGTGSSMIGFLPNDMISVCHQGFTQLIEQYKDYAAKAAITQKGGIGSITFDKFVNNEKLPLCVTDDQFLKYEQKMSYFAVEGTSARLASLTNQIITLAMAGQIEERFIDQKEALKAAIFIQSHFSFCVKDNIEVTGSISLMPFGELKLLLNGAMEYIQEEVEWVENISR